MQAKVIFHIIPKLTNGGAENVLLRIVKEFDLHSNKQIVITTKGADSDFNSKSVKKYCEVVHYKETPKEVRKVFKEHPSKVIEYFFKIVCD